MQECDLSADSSSAAQVAGAVESRQSYAPNSYVSFSGRGRVLARYTRSATGLCRSCGP
jgi:hypothetical protein